MEKYGLLFESIFKRKLTDDNTAGYLENLAKEHPYFSIAQFYLLQLSQKDTNGYTMQARKTAALFNNNHWLNFQLLEAGNTDQVQTAATIPANTENFTGNIVNNPGIAGTVEQTEVSLNEPGKTTSRTELTIGEVNATDKPAIIEQAENLAGDTMPGLETVIEKEEDTVIEEDNAIDLIEEETLASPAEEPIAAPQDEPAQAAEIKEAVNETLPTVDTATAQEEIKEVMKENPAEAVPQQEPLLFEPLHTTDYFASVGIKLSEEEKSSDKLGKQLKSFTDWLKTMKRVHAQQLAQTTQPAEVEAAGAESSIQKMAEKSNQENDVITEAMAEVLLQQGRQDKALEILEKLSLLNPSKSAYFASKINQIKEK